MRSAIRGDFERLAERRGEQEPMRVEPPGEDGRVAAGEGDEDDPARSWLARFVAR